MTLPGGPDEGCPEPGCPEPGAPDTGDCVAHGPEAGVASRRRVTGRGPAARRASPPRSGTRLGPHERIRQGWEYRQVYDNARAQHGRAFVVFAQLEPGLERRVGFVAGRRVGNAVKRNRSRRLLREAYRRLKPELPAQGFRLVFVARSPCPELSLSDIDREMRRLLQRAGLL